MDDLLSKMPNESKGTWSKIDLVPLTTQTVSLSLGMREASS